MILAYPLRRQDEVETMATSDHELIRNAISQYSLAIDQKDYENLALGFSEDVVMKFPEPIGVLKGLSAVIEAIEHALVHLKTHHALTTQNVELKDDRKAVATTYCMAMHFGTGTAEGQSLTGWGHYKDTLVKGNFNGKEDWRIVERRVVFHVPHIGDASLLGLT